MRALPFNPQGIARRSVCRIQHTEKRMVSYLNDNRNCAGYDLYGCCDLGGVQMSEHKEIKPGYKFFGYPGETIRHHCSCPICKPKDSDGMVCNSCGRPWLVRIINGVEVCKECSSPMIPVPWESWKAYTRSSYLLKRILDKRRRKRGLKP